MPEKPSNDDKFENQTQLWLDPALAGNLKIGELALPSPLPKKLTVAFASCPRVVTVRGASVPIPDAAASRSAVLVADSRETCYLDGEVRFGNDASCRPDSSRRLSGQSAYVLAPSRDYLFEGVPLSTKTRYGKCLNEAYLQRCP